jgi:hypothetical protein
MGQAMKKRSRAGGDPIKGHRMRRPFSRKTQLRRFTGDGSCTPRNVVAKTVKKMEGLLDVSDASLVHVDRDW